MRYFLEIQYRGTNYNGWQIQPNGITIQQKIDDALQTILRDAIHCLGCGRTDSGVHASQFFLHFDTKAEFPDNFLLRINAFLPPDIAVLRYFEVAENAHARYDATQRIYEYRLSSRKDVFDYGLYYYKP
ncbi:MAG: tRNA pseudouridine synthase A, partial [Bacteroidia bacterium]|nr:tRNA pseudouridine synthase A [Bacteroidia bacterium]